MKTIHIYSDESRHKNERFLLLGGIWICENNIPSAETDINALRIQNGYIDDQKQHIPFRGEFKWKKVSDRYLHVYKNIIDMVFLWIEKDIARCNVLLIDTTNPIINAYSNIKKEGYFKFLYQLYLHNSKIPAVYKIYPDSITNPTQHHVSIERLHISLERELQKKISPLLSPETHPEQQTFVNNITPVDSKHYQLIQIVDVIIGAIGYLQNGLFRRAEAKKAKVELMKYIVEKIVLSGGIKIVGKKFYVAHSTRFNIWLFNPNKKSPFVSKEDF